MSSSPMHLGMINVTAHCLASDSISRQHLASSAVILKGLLCCSCQTQLNRAVSLDFRQHWERSFRQDITHGLCDMFSSPATSYAYHTSTAGTPLGWYASTLFAFVIKILRRMLFQCNDSTITLFYAFLRRRRRRC